MVDTMVSIENKSDTLNASDRCDQCGSQAFVWAEGTSGDLLFCRHHFLKHEENIRDWAFNIIDETWKINDKSESSA